MKASHDHNQLDELVKNSFDEFELEPSTSVWTGVERELDKKAKRRVKIVLLYRRLAVAASVLLVFFFGLYLSTNQKEINDEVVVWYPQIEQQKEVAKPQQEGLKVQATTEMPTKRIIAPFSSAKKQIAQIKKNQTNEEAIDKVEKEQPEVASAEVVESTTTDEPLAELSAEKSLNAKEQGAINVNENQGVLVVKHQPVPEVVLQEGSKTQINNVYDAVNFVAQKISKTDKKIIDIEKRLEADHTIAMNYTVDLGFVKFSRIRN